MTDPVLPVASRRRWPTARAISALVLVACIGVAGCAGAGGSLPRGEMRDRVTASDETQDARRARVRLELAAAYFGKGQVNVALDEVKLALAADPNLGPAHNLRGLIYSNLGEPQLAEESYRRALQINPRDGDAMHNYGWHLCRERRYDEASALFTRAMAEPQYRDTTRTLLAQGVCEARAGRLEEAEKSLGRAYELDAGSPAIAINLAEVLLRRGELERARYFVRRVNSVPDFVSAESLWLAARVEQRLGNAVAANEFGAQLRARFPQAAETRAFDRGRFND
jgi:type IV pilus assembly protein PilF